MDAKTSVGFLRKSNSGITAINNKIADFIEQQAKSAELGRLAIKTDICYFGYNCDDGDCHGVNCLVGNHEFCLKRAELLDKVAD